MPGERRLRCKVSDAGKRTNRMGGSMWQGSMSPGVKSKSKTASQWRMVCFLIAVLVPAIGGAQESVRHDGDAVGAALLLRRALGFSHGVGNRQRQVVVARDDAAVVVTIEFRDDTDRQGCQHHRCAGARQAGSAGDASSGRRRPGAVPRDRDDRRAGEREQRADGRAGRPGSGLPDDRPDHWRQSTAAGPIRPEARLV